MGNIHSTRPAASHEIPWPRLCAQGVRVMACLQARGGLSPAALFVIAGDQNADPFHGDDIPGAAQQLLDHPLVNRGDAILHIAALD